MISGWWLIVAFLVGVLFGRVIEKDVRNGKGDSSRGEEDAGY